MAVGPATRARRRQDGAPHSESSTAPTAPWITPAQRVKPYRVGFGSPISSCAGST